MTIKNHFYISGLALSLALRQKFVETWKCPLSCIKSSHNRLRQMLKVMCHLQTQVLKKLRSVGRSNL